MAKIPFRFNRVSLTPNLDQLSRASLCESSGSEHLAQNSYELSDLINSFIDSEERSQRNEEEEEEEEKLEKERNGSDLENYWNLSETKEVLHSLLGCQLSKGVKQDDFKLIIIAETELACSRKEIETNSSSNDQMFKRGLMSDLRNRGFDAGLCKSRTKKASRFPIGSYEYIDIIDVATRTRYIVEVSLADEFTIARPTDHYQSLLDVFPRIFVGKPMEMKQVLRLMCAAAKKSMKSTDMHVPPWRKYGYMQSKWLGSYKRTTNTNPGCHFVSDSGVVSPGKRLVGFESSPATFNDCRCEIGRTENLRVGNLALALSGMHL